MGQVCCQETPIVIVQIYNVLQEQGSKWGRGFVLARGPSGVGWRNPSDNLGWEMLNASTFGSVQNSSSGSYDLDHGEPVRGGIKPQTILKPGITLEVVSHVRREGL